MTQTIQTEQNILGQISQEQLQKSQRKFTKWILALLSFTEALSLKDSIHKTIEIIIAFSGGHDSFSLPIPKLAERFYGQKYKNNPDEYSRAMRRRLDTLESWQARSGITLIQRLPNDLFLLSILNHLQSILLTAYSNSLNNSRKLKNQIIISAYALAHELQSNASPSSSPKTPPVDRFLKYFEFKKKILPLITDPALRQKELAEINSRIHQDKTNLSRTKFRLRKYDELRQILSPGSPPSLNMEEGEGINFEHSSNRELSSSILPENTSQIPFQNSPEKPAHQPVKKLGEHPEIKNVNDFNNSTCENTLCTNVQFEYAESMLKTLSKMGVKQVNFEFYSWVGEDERVGRGKMSNLDPLEAIKKLPKIFERNKNGQEISIAIQDRWVIPLDDVKGEYLEKVKPFILWVQESSPKNHHVLMGFDDIKTEKQRESIVRRLKEGLKTDKGGSRIKLAGVVNHKPKHKENPPMVTPIKLKEEGRTTSEAELIYVGIIKKEESVKEVTSPLPHVQREGGKYRVEPYYGEYVARAPMNEAGKAPDVSRADFAFCRAMLRRGFGREEVVEALMRESKCAKGTGGGKYSERTVKEAKKSLEKEGLI